MFTFNLHTRTYKELVDRAKIDKLITGLLSGSITLTRFLNKNKEKTKEELITGLIKRLQFYKIKSTKKNLIVKYEFTIPNFGRVYASGKYISMASFPREIRATLAADNYIDIDINNCHPVLALQLCDKYNIRCDELREYVNNREDYLKKCMDAFNCSRDDAKVLFLQIMYGGSYNSWAKNLGVTIECPDWLKNFDKNVKSIYNALLKKYADDVKYLNDHGKPEKEYNQTGACVSWILQNEECKILNCMLNYIADFGKAVSNCVLCFDGFMMLKERFTPDLLKKLEDHVYKNLNYRIKLSVKPFTDIINLDGITADEDTYTQAPAPQTQWYDHDVMLNSLFKSYDIAKEYFERYHAFDETTNKFVYANLDDNKVEFLNKEELKTRYANLFYIDDEDKSKKFVDSWISDPYRRFVKKVEEIPYSDVFSVDKIFPVGKVMNTFTGFDKRIKDDITEEQIARGNNWFDNYYMPTLVRLAEGNDEWGYWLLCFLAQIVQQPANRKDRAVIIVGEQGNGKNSVLEAVGRIIGYNDHYSTTSDPNKYFGEHAIEHAHKLLCNFDESSCKNAEKFAEQLKTFITTSTVEINEKFVKQYKIQNHARMVATSNKTTALPVDFKSGDRRFVMFAARDFSIDGVVYEVNTPKHTEFFNEFYDVINAEWFPRYFYDKLMSVDISNWDYKAKFDTELKNDMMYMSKNSVEQFLDDYRLDDIISKSLDVDKKWLERMNIKCDGFACKIDVDKLYTTYTEYCSLNGFNDPMNKRNFNRSIRENKKFKPFFLSYLKSNSKYWYIANRTAYGSCFGDFKVTSNGVDMNFSIAEYIEADF